MPPPELTAHELVDREPNPAESTFPSEILTCRTADGAVVQLFLKRAESAAHDSHGHRRGIPYEAVVYERILRPIGMSTPRFHSAGGDGNGGGWLVIDHLAGAERLDRSADADESVVRAASWIGCFHARAERLPSAAGATLHRHDADYYAGWARRTLEYLEDAEARYPWLPELSARFEHDCAPALAGGRLTAIHGELYPRNVLVRGADVHPIDWESAALGPGEIDLVALIDGWDEVHDRALAAYVDARFGGRAPAGFAHDCDVARLYLAFRWLGDRPYWTNLDSAHYDLMALRAVGERMGLLP